MHFAQSRAVFVMWNGGCAYVKVMTKKMNNEWLILYFSMLIIIERILIEVCQFLVISKDLFIN